LANHPIGGSRRTLAKQHHFLDFPDWFLDWVFPFLLIIFRLQGAPEDYRSARNQAEERQEQFGGMREAK
jgi:hypothetical protein